MCSQLTERQLSLFAIILDPLFPLSSPVACYHILLSQQSLLNSSPSLSLTPIKTFLMLS
jgi:hypothetical protein